MKKSLLKHISTCASVKSINTKLNSTGAVAMESVPRGARPLFTSALTESALVITPERFREDFTRAIAAIKGDQACMTLPPLLYGDSDDAHVIACRNSAVKNLLDQNSKIIIVTSPSAALQPVADQNFLDFGFLNIKTGDILNREELIEKLVSFSYLRQPVVDRPGTFSVRGDIIDIYAPGENNPWRIDFFDDEIETIRNFDPWSQRSRNRLESISVPSQNTPEKGVELICMLPESKLIVIDEDVIVADELKVFAESNNDESVDYSELTKNFFRTLSRRRRLTFLSTGSPDRFQTRIQVKGRNADFPDRRFETIKSELQKMIDCSDYLVVTSESTTQCMRIKRIFSELELPSTIVPKGESTLNKGVISIHNSFYGKGFILEKPAISVLCEDDIFGSRIRTPIEKHTTLDEAMPIRHFSDIEAGDLIVHVDHGIGIYEGLKTLSVEGKRKDFLELRYAGTDRLYVPVDKVHLVQRYIGPPDEKPALHPLSGVRWKNARARARKAVEIVAKELIKLYASRAVASGFAFPEDTIWQQELEASFPFQETDDQLVAIEAVKKDMESPAPMDRLVCGDVGYGKTEVAVRAAFKAVMAGKQVAILCPTTLLASQHFITFTERYGPFPVEIRLLSRLKTKEQQRETLKRLKAGTTDVIIGTHRLLSKDVEFKELGLLIIDEEHRFGVKDKEKLKQLRNSVDVLSMTATPIPRTLHMALTEVRNMSVIKTPPRDRLPITTRVAPINPETVGRAIRREMERDGQVFYLHNRVETIESAANFVRSCYSEAKVTVAHGQMPRAKLERIMNDFLDHRIDVLVCSTIIESGLDIPAANTIIISRADAFGLAQLYQIRGRVGRSGRQAYALLLTGVDAAMTSTARERLDTIVENTDLGSGFKIAMKDLEIRGAGSLLGYQQSGFIAAVGFDLYCRLLKEAVQEQKGLPPEDKNRRENVEISVDIHAHIPDDYIEVLSDKLDVYRRILSCGDRGDVQELADELRDRFGRLPLPVVNLLAVQNLRITAFKHGVIRIGKMGRFIMVHFQEDSEIRDFSPARLSVKFPKITKLKEKNPVIRVQQIESRNEAFTTWLEELIKTVSEEIQ